MDKTINKPDQTQRLPLDERKRDRGDNLKKQDGIKNKINDGANSKLAHKPVPNQGDVPVNNKVTKLKAVSHVNKDKVTNDRNKKQNDVKPKLNSDHSKVDTGAEKMLINKTSEMYAAVNKTKIGERNVGDKASLRYKAVNNQPKDTKNSMKSEIKIDHLKNQPILESVKETSDSIKPECMKTNLDDVKKEKETTNQRKPMIKTVKSKNDDKVYKAVTFTEQRRTKPTVLEINIPNLQAKKKTKLVDKNLDVKQASLQGNSIKSTSKLNITNKSQYSRRNRLTERIKRKKLNRCISSPDKFKKVDSPPTEVAKWAPSCLNAHTKPYYEAWVDTTLAAISKISKKDKLYFQKENIIKSFQKSLELGTESPDLIHEQFTDECYTGKIRIKQRNLSKKSRQPIITPLLDNYKQG